MSELDRRVGSRIRHAREQAGLTQRDVAQALGMSTVGYGDIERGKNQASLELLFAVSRYLRRPIAWFLGLSSDLTDDESRLVHLYQQIRNPHLREMVFTFMEGQVRADEQLRSGS